MGRANLFRGLDDVAVSFESAPLVIDVTGHCAADAGGDGGAYFHPAQVWPGAAGGQ